jgi:hypothetical protein
MKMNSFTVLKVASEINSMTVDELQVLAECINEKKADALSAFISYVIQDRQIMENQKELV